MLFNTSREHFNGAFVVPCDNIIHRVIFKLDLLSPLLEEYWLLWEHSNYRWPDMEDTKLLFSLTDSSTKCQVHISLCSSYVTYIEFCTWKAVSVKVQTRRSMWQKPSPCLLTQCMSWCRLHTHIQPQTQRDRQVQTFACSFCYLLFFKYRRNSPGLQLPRDHHLMWSHLKVSKFKRRRDKLTRTKVHTSRWLTQTPKIPR